MKNVRIFVFTASAAVFLISLAPDVLAGDAAKGKEIYNGKGVCGTCHGATGKGDGVAAAAMNPKPRSFAKGQFQYDTDGDGKTGTDNDLLNILKNGTAKYGGSATMPANPNIPEGELRNVIAYIRTLQN